jgi:PAP2 superfamily protein
MSWLNSIYSFIHIPGTILFLIWLFWYTETRSVVHGGEAAFTLNQASLYEARRRTMAFCNLIAFIVFTAWPCMPPRLLSDPNVQGPSGAVARQYEFVDTVHGDGGQGSVWTQNKFCNQYAAMPSLHFGYSLLIGLTVMTIPLKPSNSSVSISGRKVSLRGTTFHVRLPSTQRAICVTIGVLYPLVILIAIIATANHFILDAVAGAMVCGIAWSGNNVLLNLLPLQDWFLYYLRVHFPGGPVSLVEKNIESELERSKIVQQLDTYFM